MKFRSYDIQPVVEFNRTMVACTSLEESLAYKASNEVTWSGWGLYGRDAEGFATHIADRDDYEDVARLYEAITGVNPGSEPGLRMGLPPDPYPLGLDNHIETVIDVSHLIGMSGAIPASMNSRDLPAIVQDLALEFDRGVDPKQAADEGVYYGTTYIEAVEEFVEEKIREGDVLIDNRPSSRP